ncbi:hypothetical protein [Bradyrhizobium yuanmingense]|uniref:hypothetical protein n=1 Tax=Bradyrhizobium yuanmingense TaxID=108015 RepID=UPI0004AE9B12|nr:hypothetical protein [Bradyrhizobium yuanmingense]
MFNIRLLFASALRIFGNQPSVSPKVQRRMDRQMSADMQRAKFIGNRSRYQPHQGERERNRRAIQIARGIIATN